MIELKNINKTYKSKKRTVKALVSLSLSFPNCGMFFVTGPSGAGKSTFLKIVSLKDWDYEGELLFDGRNARSLSMKERTSFRASFFGFVSQDLDLIDALTVRENLTLAKDMTGEETDEKELLDILDRLGLPRDILDEKPENLSGGQRQRVAIGRALLKDSRVILCDEPTGNLDTKNSEGVMELLKSLSKERLVLVVSHDTRLAKKYGDDITRIENGEIASSYIPKCTGSQPHSFRVSKSSLRMRTETKIAWSTLKGTTKKLVFTGISTVFATSFMLTSMSLYGLDVYEAFDHAISAHDIHMLNVQKNEIIGNGSTKVSTMSLNDVKRADAHFSTCVPVLSYAGMKERVEWDETRNEYVCNGTGPRGLIDASIVPFDEYGIKVIGDMPQEKEALITVYQAYSWGVIPFDQAIDQEALRKAKDFEFRCKDRVLGGELSFRVSGLLDTGRRFAGYASSANHFSESQALRALETEMHDNMFVNHEGFLQLQKNLREARFDPEMDYLSFYVSTKEASIRDVEKYSAESLEKEPDFSYSYRLRLSESFDVLLEFRDQWAMLLVIIGGILSAFSLFFFAGFLFAVVQDNTDTWTILFDLGAKKRNVFSILALQNALLCLVTTIGSLIPYGLFIFGLNSYIDSAFATSFSALSVSGFAPLVAFSVLLLLGSIISLVLICRLGSSKVTKKIKM